MKKTAVTSGKGKKIKIVLAVTLAAVIIVTAVVLSVVFFDSTANAATSSQSFTPTSYPVGPNPGSALIVYDPGSTGASKTVAADMASDLQAKGFFVTLAGIKSAMAVSNTSQYQVVVVGGPIDNGKASSSVQSYLSNLTPANNTIIGVFGVGNTNAPANQIAPLPANSSFTIKETLEINTNQDSSSQSNEFITQLLS